MSKRMFRLRFPRALSTIQTKKIRDASHKIFIFLKQARTYIYISAGLYTIY